MMTHSEIVGAVAAFEKEHPVETYRSHGFNVWPILRTWIAYRKCQEENDFARPCRTEPTLIRNKKKGRKTHVFARTLRSLVREKGAFSIPASCSVFLTHSSRVIQLGAKHYNTVVDPIVDVLNAHDRSAVIWEYGPDVGLRTHSPFRIEGKLEHAWQRHKKLHHFLPKASEPSWYPEVRAFAARFVAMSFAWENVRQRFEHIAVISRIMKSWLCECGAKTLIVDNWYSPRGMAAIAAAKQIGIRTADLQHGMQTHGHFAYSGWEKSPPVGYEVMPDMFWVWGNSAARSLVETNRIIAPNSVIIGGNMWLDQWTSSVVPEMHHCIQEAQQLTAPFKEVILVTLQGHSIRVHELRQLIAQSPKEWLWLVRLHRDHLHEIDTTEELLQQSGHPHIIVRQATFMPLYALFQGVRVHLTWYSTCALEALAFGVPSIVLHPNSKTAFRTFLDAGVMLYAKHPQDALSLVPQCANISRERCREMARDVFAPASKTIGRVLSLFPE
jgi:hypothetical protein